MSLIHKIIIEYRKIQTRCNEKKQYYYEINIRYYYFKDRKSSFSSEFTFLTFIILVLTVISDLRNWKNYIFKIRDLLTVSSIF